MLKPKQKKFIELLMQALTVEQACKLARIHKSTYYNWLKNDEFKSELNKLQEIAYESSLGEMKKLCNHAISVYNNLLFLGSDNLRFRIARAIINDTVKLKEMKELVDRVENLENNTK